MTRRLKILAAMTAIQACCFGAAVVPCALGPAAAEETMPRILCDNPADFKLLGRLRAEHDTWAAAVNAINMSHADWLKHPSCMVAKVTYSAVAPAGRAYIDGRLYDIWKVELWVNADPLPVKYLLRPAETQPVSWGI